MSDYEKRDVKQIEGLSLIDRQLAAYVSDLFDSNESELNYFRPIWEDCYKLWLRWRKAATGSESRKPRLFVPLVFSMIETVLPLIVLSLMSVREFIDVIPTETSDNKAARGIKRLINWQFDHVPDKFLKLVRWIKSSLMYGTGIIQPYWDDRTKQSYVRESKSVLGKLVKAVFRKKKDGTFETKNTGYVGPNFRNIDLENFRRDMSGMSVKELTWAGDIMSLSKYELKTATDPADGQPLYKNLELLFNNNLENNKDDRKEKKEVKRTGADDTAPAGGYNPRYEIQNFWGISPKHFMTGKESDKDDFVCVNYLIGARTVPILTRYNDKTLYNGEIPYIRILDTIDPHDFFGEGKIRPAASLQHEKNNSRNQMLESCRRSLRTRFYASHDGQVDEYALQFSGPGGIIKMRDPSRDVQQEQINFDLSHAIAREGLIDQDFYQTTGAFPQIGMGQTPKDTKASIYLSFEKTIQKRFGFTMMTIEQMGFSELARWFMLLNARHIDKDIIIRVTGDENPVIIPYNDLQKGYDFKLIGSASEPLTSYENRRQMVEDALELFGPYNDQINIQPIMRNYFEAAGFRDSDLIMRNPSLEFMRRLQQTIAKMVEDKMPSQVIIQHLMTLKSPFQGMESGTIGRPGAGGKLSHADFSRSQSRGTIATLNKEGRI